MIHHSLNHDIVRVVAFVCPLVSIDKSQSQAQIVPKYFRVDSLLRFISKINMTVKGKKNVRWRNSMEITKCFQNPLAYNSLIFWLFLNQQKICADSKQPININVYGKGCQKVTYNHFPEIPLVVLYIRIACHLCVSCIFRVKRVRKETWDPKGTMEVIANVPYR